MDFNFWCVSGPELSILANTIAIYISEHYNADDLLSIAYFVETLGNNLSLLGNQKLRCENSLNSSNYINFYNTNNSTMANQNQNKLDKIC